MKSNDKKEYSKPIKHTRYKEAKKNLRNWLLENDEVCKDLIKKSILSKRTLEYLKSGSDEAEFTFNTLYKINIHVQKMHGNGTISGFFPVSRILFGGEQVKIGNAENYEKLNTPEEANDLAREFIKQKDIETIQKIYLYGEDIDDSVYWRIRKGKYTFKIYRGYDLTEVLQDDHTQFKKIIFHSET